MSIILGRTGVVTDQGDVRLYDATGAAFVVSQGDLPAVPKGIMAFGVNDGIAIPQRVDRSGGVASALHVPLMNDSFEGIVTNPNRWSITSTTMAATQTTAGGLFFNSGAITTITTGYMVKSVRQFTKMQHRPLMGKFRARLENYANAVMELGFGDAPTFNGANTVGAYFQITASGVCQPVLTYNSVDVTGAAITLASPTTNFYTFDIVVDDDFVLFTVQNTATNQLVSRQVLQLPVTGPRLFSSVQVQALARVYTTGVAPASAPKMVLTDVYVGGLDALVNPGIGEIASYFGRSSLENPLTGAQTINWTNSTAPTAATLSNTAAGYTTLGGNFGFVAVAGATTDYALFGFQCPANFQLDEIEIETYNTGAAVATTSTNLIWGIATQLTAVSLATANAIRYAVGMQSLAIGAAIGAKAERITKTFQTPIFCGSGRFLVVMLRMPIGTATAAQVIQGHVSIGGKFL